MSRDSRLALGALAIMALTWPLYAIAYAARVLVETIRDGWSRAGEHFDAIDDWAGVEEERVKVTTFR